MRLINADKLHYHRVWIASIKKGEYNGMKSAVVVFADEIDKNKTARVDAVPVVRCWECKWYKEGTLLGPTKFCFRLRDADGERIGYNFASDDFCSHGERKGGDK